MPPKSKRTKSNILLPDITSLWQSIPSGRVLLDQNSKMVLCNDYAKSLLKYPNVRQELKKMVRMTTARRDELVGDYPTDDRIIRIHTMYMENGGGQSYITAYIEDVTDEWIEERQKEILEHIASVSAQSVPTIYWLQSLLNKIVVLKRVKSCSIMLYVPQEKKLESVISSSNIKQDSLKLSVGEGIAGLTAKLRMPVTTLDTSKDKRYKKHSVDSRGPSSLLSIPMIVGDKLTGVFIVRDIAGKPFREQDRAFYTILANRLAVTLEYKTVLDKLRQEHRKLDAVINNSLQGMLLLDQQNKIVIANPAFLNLIAKTKDQVVNKALSDVIPGMEEIITKDKMAFDTEMQLNNVEGKPWVGLSIATISNGTDARRVLSLWDITAEKQFEQMQNDFIATATHELRTPLTAILGYLSMLNNKSEELNDKQKLYLQRIGQASKNLSALVEDLLSALRLDQDTQKQNHDKQRLLPIIKDVVHSLEPKAMNKHIKINIPKKSALIYADSHALQKVLLNLVDNAIKYSRPYSKISITLKYLNNSHKFAQVCIRDTGVGIPRKEQAKLFQKFYRVPNELSVEAGGTGLGLYITRKLVESWGGKIELIESSTKGTAFAFTIPTQKIDFPALDSTVVSGAQKAPK